LTIGAAQPLTWVTKQTDDMGDTFSASIGSASAAFAHHTVGSNKEAEAARRPHFAGSSHVEDTDQHRAEEDSPTVVVERFQADPLVFEAAAQVPL
jgi:hypothetical protein